MIQVLSYLQQRGLEQRLNKKYSLNDLVLMESVAAGMARELLALLKMHSDMAGVWLLVGPGSNGADGLAILRILLGSEEFQQRRFDLRVFDWPSSASSLNHIQRKLLEDHFTLECFPLTQLRKHVQRVSKIHGKILMIDAIFGAGFKNRRWPKKLDAQLFQDLAKERKNLIHVAIDVPSGLQAGGGVAKEFQKLKADYCLCVAGPKRAQLSGVGVDQSGELRVVDLIVPTHAGDGDAQWCSELHHVLDWFHLHALSLKQHRRSAHKNSLGKAFVLGGPLSAGGATRLGAEMLMRAGVGYVAILGEQSRGAAAEWVRRPMLAGDAFALQLKEFSAGIFGPGLPAWNRGLDIDSVWMDRCERILNATHLKSLVFDGGGLTVLAQTLLTTRIRKRNLPMSLLLTPHPKEACDMLEILIGRRPDIKIIDDRFLLLSELRRALSATDLRGDVAILLKGAYPIVISVGSDIQPVAFQLADPRIATAGSGDVFSGLALAVSMHIAGLRGEKFKKTARSLECSKSFAALLLAQAVQMATMHQLEIDENLLARDQVKLFAKTWSAILKDYAS